jgi:hypothetical protein
MQNLTLANAELFRRAPDECFATFDELWRHCQEAKARSVERWHPPAEIQLDVGAGGLGLSLGEVGTFGLNDWSFSQLCSLAGVSKDTVNKLSSSTACEVFRETLPGGTKPLQVMTTESRAAPLVRSIHGVSYTRLFDADLLSMVREFATDFQPPQEARFAPGGQPTDDGALTTAETGRTDDTPPWEEPEQPRPRGGTGLYRGEQDMFVFLIDPLGWTDIGGEAFAPGFFLWNSEVGKRSIGVQTFWFQAVCQNHIVWDAVEVVEFSRKHTANVHESFSEIRRIIERLVAKRDERRDGFARVIGKAMATTLGESSDQVLKLLSGRGITRSVAKEALKIAQESGRFTVFSVVDALTRLNGRMKNVGERTDADVKAASLLAMAG